MRESYFHEDDYCQVEILPTENYEFSRNQLGEIESFSTKHHAGSGWTDMYVRSGAPTPLESVRLIKADLESELSAYLPQFDRVLTGYSTYREECDNTTAFGANSNFVLYAAYDGGVISKLWLSIHGLSTSDTKNAKRLFDHLSSFQLMLVDWSMSAIVVLADSTAVTRYLREFQANPKAD